MSDFLSVKDIGGKHQQLNHLVAIARHNYRLNQRFQRHLPDKMRGLCQAIRIRDHALVIFTSSSAVATRLKTLEHDLIEALQQDTLEVSSLIIRVQPKAVVEARPKHLRLTPNARALFEQTADNVSDPALQNALRRLAQRHL